ncbi:hypothetical protein [Dichotomicrobium thermohalophilum]|uniref:Uncharacterized protein n=1 Tax=Dichotomicrobium thermohalophilum TaxID=933063 RepID=A0A397QAW6_9HYPH|nr:hypothetical protein [Dichotomicrobium thermohalophilum]RIA56627.1 hypothetical protein BXY53_1733 [Dichotomicrobium thermohalophilum]
MFAEIVFASLMAAGGPAALAQTPEPQPAVMHYTDGEQGAPRLQLAADLGCPRYYDRRRGYDKRCYRRRADPYRDGYRDRYGRYDDERYYDERPGRYSDRDDPYYEDAPYRGDWNGPRDTLRDRYGRPYPDAEPGFDEDVPPYRRGAYERPGPRDRYYDDRDLDDARERWRRGETSRPFREGRAFDAFYQRSSYREPLYKKKDTGPMTVTASHTIITPRRSRNAASAAGSTV